MSKTAWKDRPTPDPQQAMAAAPLETQLYLGASFRLTAELGKEPGKFDRDKAWAIQRDCANLMELINDKLNGDII
jgi:hypothetical protein